MPKIKILGVNINNEPKEEVLNKIRGFLNDGKKHFIVTPNPEILLAKDHDEELYYILNSADIAIADGFGIKLWAKTIGINMNRITGADLLSDILQIAGKNDFRVLAVLWEGGLSTKEEVRNALPEIKNLKVISVDRENPEYNHEDIDNFKPDIMLVGLGCPYQEKFIYHNLNSISSLKLGIVVGGAFDFLTGKIKRAPMIFRNLGLEWAWRLIQQPKRLIRIFNAIIVFSYKFVLWFYILRYFYRPVVACMLYKKIGQKNYFLLVERKDEPGHWQIPQGGIEDERIDEAGARELYEELNTRSFIPKNTFKNLFKYEFGSSSVTTNATRINGYKGVKLDLFIAEYTGLDSEISVNFWDHLSWKWVEENDLLNQVHPIRQDSTKIFLEKFNSTII